MKTTVTVLFCCLFLASVVSGDSDYYGPDTADEYGSSSSPSATVYIQQKPPPVSNSYSSSAYKKEKHELAQPLSAAHAQNLNALYSLSPSPYGINTGGQQIITDIYFARDFAQFDPFSNNSQWIFRRFPAFNFTVDHATFVRHPWTVDFLAVPLQQWFPQTDGPIASAANNDAAISPRQNVPVAANEKVLMEVLFSCYPVAVEQHPYPSNLVLNPDNDVRVGACAFALSDLSNTGLKFRVLATRQGVWASYTREPLAKFVQNATFRAFDVFRQIAVRKRYDDWIDAAVEYDRMQGTVTWFINGKEVWKVDALGTLPPNDGQNRVGLDTGAQDPQMIAVPMQVVTQLALFTSFHSVDPNNLLLDVNTNLALIRLVGGTPEYANFYGPNMKFYDNNSMRSNKLYGQGVKMTLKRMVVIKKPSVAAAATSLPLPPIYNNNKYDQNWAADDNNYHSNDNGYQKQQDYQ